MSSLDSNALYFGFSDNSPCGYIKMGETIFGSSIYDIEYIESTTIEPTAQTTNLYAASTATTTSFETTTPSSATETTTPFDSGESTTAPITTYRMLKLTYSNGNVVYINLDNQNLQEQINALNSSVNSISETNSMLFQKLSQEAYSNLSDGDKGENILYCIVD